MHKPDQEKTSGATRYVLRLIPGMKLVQYQLDLLAKCGIQGLLPVSVRNRNREQEVVVDISSYIKLPDYGSADQINCQSDYQGHLLSSLLNILKCADDHLLPLNQLSSELDDIFISSSSGERNKSAGDEQISQLNLHLIFWPVAVHNSNGQANNLSESHGEQLTNLEAMPVEQNHDESHIRLIENLGHFCEVEPDLIDQIIICVRNRSWQQALLLCRQETTRKRFHGSGEKADKPAYTLEDNNQNLFLTLKKEPEKTHEPDHQGKIESRMYRILERFAVSVHWLILAVFIFMRFSIFDIDIDQTELFIALCTLIMAAHIINISRQIQLRLRKRDSAAPKTSISFKRRIIQLFFAKVRIIQEKISYQYWQFAKHWNSFFQSRQTSVNKEQKHYHQTMIMAEDQQAYTIAILTEIRLEPSNASSAVICPENNHDQDDKQRAFKKAYILTDQFIVGRDPYKSDFFLPDESIGRQHARISRKSGSFFLVDLGSANGSSVNGKKVNRHEEIWLPDQCEIQFGHLLFLFEIDG